MNYFPCSHDELTWGRRKEYFAGKEIIVCGRCREEMPAILTRPRDASDAACGPLPLTDQQPRPWGESIANWATELPPSKKGRKRTAQPAQPSEQNGGQQ